MHDIELWLRNVSYCGIIIQLELLTLELRRLRLDLLFCYKIIVFGLVGLNVNFCDFFQFNVTSTTRDHKYDCLSLDARL